MRNPKKGFTIVELIVVITILIILWTIAFISLQWYNKNARDSVRLSNIRDIETGLELILTKTWKLPDPDNKIIITSSGVLVWYQWTAGMNTQRIINIPKEMKDPIDMTYYTYVINKNNNSYQLWYSLESWQKTMKTVGADLWILTDITKTPIQEISSIQTAWTIDIQTTPTTYMAYLNGETTIEWSGATLQVLQQNYNNGWSWFDSPKYCPPWFIEIPWNKEFNQPWFCIAQYEMTYSNRSDNPSVLWRNTYSYVTSTNVVSQPWYPIANINQNDAITACRTMGSWYHLITNNEWMTIARNLEWVGINWSWGSPWIGRLYRGISNEGIYGCPGNPNGERAVPSTDTTCTKRVLTLSNWSKIWDFAGNVWEHVDRSNNPNITTAQVWNGDLCNTSWFWYINGDPAITCQANYWPSAQYTKWWSDIGMWSVSNNSLSDKVFRRGGGANYAYDTGIFAIHLNWTSLGQSVGVGFRCAY
jgi:type II secretory pathway pseudopilin PulG